VLWRLVAKLSQGIQLHLWPSVNPVRRPGEHCKLPPVGLEAKPQQKTHFYAFQAQKLHLVVTFCAMSRGFGWWGSEEGSIKPVKRPWLWVRCVFSRTVFNNTRHLWLVLCVWVSEVFICWHATLCLYEYWIMLPLHSQSTVSCLRSLSFGVLNRVAVALEVTKVRATASCSFPTDSCKFLTNDSTAAECAHLFENIFIILFGTTVFHHAQIVN